MTITLGINDITMPVPYARTPPRKEKVNNHMMYYLEHGKLKSAIQVTQKGMLLDGYCDYIVAVACGMDKLECVVSTDIVNRHMRTNNRKIKKAPINGKSCISGKMGNVRIAGSSYRLRIIQARRIISRLTILSRYAVVVATD